MQKIKPGPHQAFLNPIFTKAITNLKTLHKTNPNIDWFSITTKQIYNVLTKKQKKTPKIIL